jgi:PQQ-dependent catabolism-associated beta-propeller protein
MAVSPDGKLAVNTSETTNMVHWIDTTTNQLIDNTLVGQRPRYTQFSADGKLLWVSSEIGGTVAVIDVARREVVKTIAFTIQGVHKDRVQPVGIKLTSDGKYAFVALGPANHVAVVDQKTYEPMSSVLVARRVWQMALTPDEKMLFATNGISNDVSVIDVPTLKAIKSIQGRALSMGLGDQAASRC